MSDDQRVFLGGGQRIGSADPAAGFPPVKEEAVRAAIEDQLERWRLGAGDLAVCGANRGADLIFAEICCARGARVLVLLPSDEERFIADSLPKAGSGWEKRFRRLMKQGVRAGEVEKLEMPAASRGPADAPAFNRWLVHTAASRAGAGSQPFALLVWDGEPDGESGEGVVGLTALVGAALEPERRVIIDPRQIAPYPRDLHFARTGGPKRILTLDGGGVRGILTLQLLQRLELLLRQQHGRPDLRLGDYFDLIAGTSTGAIIATAVAMGMELTEIERKYKKLAKRVFRRRLSLGAIRAKFDARGLADALADLYGDTPIGSPEVLTGLLIVTKRIDSGSQWPVSNFPRATYFHRRPGSRARANADYELRTLVRASTAAPHYFAPQKIEVFPGEEKDFIDGGASTANNPSLEALKLVSLGGFGVGWETGPEKLLIVSCGSGRGRAGETVSRIAGAHALKALKSIMTDCADLVETMMQWLSDSPTARFIDSDLQSLEGDLLGGRPLLSYLRYDASLADAEWLRRALGKKLSDKKIAKLAAMDVPRNMKRLVKLGQRAALERMTEAHLPAAFKLP